jgi:hypothetical protein
MYAMCVIASSATPNNDNSRRSRVTGIVAGVAALTHRRRPCQHSHNLCYRRVAGHTSERLIQLAILKPAGSRPAGFSCTLLTDQPKLSTIE